LSDPFPNLTSVIPAPSIDADGKAAPAILYPLPVSQPIRLFNRGLPTEHYGFYTYYDRSIFLKSTLPLKASDVTQFPEDEDGGSRRADASVRCTWAQTRFLVQIWTQPSKAGMGLIPRFPPTPSSNNRPSSPTASISASSSATDFSRPGSFPYPVTITLDRHGGDPKLKMLYCYGMDTQEHIASNQKKLQLEFRNFGGILVQPAGLFNTSRPGAGDGTGNSAEVGIDGGTGGCRCEWRNWLSQA
jgi:hypothetical protein